MGGILKWVGSSIIAASKLPGRPRKKHGALEGVLLRFLRNLFVFASKPSTRAKSLLGVQWIAHAPKMFVLES